MSSDCNIGGVGRKESRKGKNALQKMVVRKRRKEREVEEEVEAEKTNRKKPEVTHTHTHTSNLFKFTY